MLGKAAIDDGRPAGNVERSDHRVAVGFGKQRRRAAACVIAEMRLPLDEDDRCPFLDGSRNRQAGDTAANDNHFGRRGS
ncbi:hypothetical protein D3C71_2149390 [compost metagenome]